MHELSDESWSNNMAFHMGPSSDFLKNRAMIGTSIESASNLDSEITKLSRYPEIHTALLEWFRCLKSTAPNESVIGSLSSRKVDLHRGETESTQKNGCGPIAGNHLLNYVTPSLLGLRRYPIGLLMARTPN